MKRYVLLLVAGFMLVGSLKAQSKKDSIQLILDENYSELPAITTMVVHKDKVIDKVVRGYGDILKKEKVETNAVYNLADVTTFCTAVGIMYLKDQEELTYKDPIQKFFPGLPDTYKKISVRDLIFQSSGLPTCNYDKLMNHEGKDIKEKLINYLVKEDRLNFERGRRLQIHFMNYLMLALVIEEVSGKDYEKFMKKRIFKPMGMKRDFDFPYDGRLRIKNRIDGFYMAEDDNFKRIKDVEECAIKGVSGLHMSVSDLKKFYQQLDEHEIISEKTYRASQKVPFMRGVKKFYSFGWFHEFNKGQKFMYQIGNSCGFTNIVIHIPAEQLEVYIFSNQASLFSLRHTAFKIANLYSRNTYSIK